MRPALLMTLAVILNLSVSTLHADAPATDPIKVEQQPFVAATERIVEALKYVGAPLPEGDVAALQAAMKLEDAKQSVFEMQKILDQHCLVTVRINSESRVSAVEGPVKKELMQQGWRTFLVKIHNEARITPELVVESPQSAPVYERGKGSRERPRTTDKLVDPSAVSARFLDIAVFKDQPLKPTLSGLECEYRIVQLFSRDVGRREATLSFSVGQGTQDLGFRNETPILFECLPAVEVLLGVIDHDGTPTMASFVFRDQAGRVHPNPARRLAPDFFFHEQVYRGDGEIVHLAPGKYKVTISRGPEYLTETREVTIPAGKVSHREAFQLTRWVHPLKRGWVSGDHHVHAAGCAHYDSPTEGVGPGDMMRHILGEDLNVGCVLSWGPCWYTQKQYFEGKASALSRPNHIMRYDVEVSGFPSSHAGHLCLLRLKEDDYPGTTLLEEWPSWTHPVLKWGQEQGGVVGYSHSGWGLMLPDKMPNGERRFHSHPWGGAPAGWDGQAADTLPDYEMPRFDGIGANEFIVTGPLGVCDFISAVDTPVIWELNIWYHMLNCGVRTRISGETDFPCIYGDKVGLGRVYVGRGDDDLVLADGLARRASSLAPNTSPLPPSPAIDFDTWAQGIKDGRSYCSDGLSHVFDFKVNDVELGLPGSGGAISQLNLDQPCVVRITADVAALLAEAITPETERIRTTRLDSKPYWHIERARLGDTRKVPVEVIINGEVAARQEIEANGETRPLDLTIDIKQSSWIALRILPSVHTNPIFVHVGDKPIRSNKKSAQWCRQAVDVCWNAKQNQIRESERAAAKEAYDAAANYYDSVIEESK